MNIAETSKQIMSTTYCDSTRLQAHVEKIDGSYEPPSDVYRTI